MDNRGCDSPLRITCVSPYEMLPFQWFFIATPNWEFPSNCKPMIIIWSMKLYFHVIFMGSLLVVSVGSNKVFNSGPYSVYWGLLIRCCTRSKLVSPLVLCFR